MVAQKLLSALATPYDLDGQVIATQASIGISIYPDHAQDADILIKNADMAMYRAKEEGRNNYQFFAPGDELPRRPAVLHGKRSAPGAGARRILPAISAAGQSVGRDIERR